MKEVNEDIFDWLDENKDNKVVLVHCISADKALGAGIAKEIEERFKVKSKLNEIIYWDGFGTPIFTAINENFWIVNLVTKWRYFEKPTYETIEEALRESRPLVRCIKDVKIVMPRIGCGLDGLDWNRVKGIVEKEYMGLDVTVCYL